jgi:osmotically-inducible protein OsmY
MINFIKSGIATALLIAQFFTVDAALAEFFEVTTRTGRKIDSQISEQGITGHNIAIEDRAGVITLRGGVASEHDRQLIERIAWDTKGVENVYNLLEIRPPTGAQQMRDQITVERARPRIEKFDDDIVRRNIARNIALTEGGRPESLDLEIYVSDGMATIRGQRNNHGEIDRILSAALMSEGVQGVNSEITLNGSPYMSVWRETNPEARREARAAEQTVPQLRQ